jgi:hypothetical protein
MRKEEKDVGGEPNCVYSASLLADLITGKAIPVTGRGGS